MSVIKFNNDPKHFYDCLECSYDGTKATIKELEDRPQDVSGGFGVFEYTDPECTKVQLVEDLSRFSLVWEDDEDTVILSSDTDIYNTYFIYNEGGFVVDEITTKSIFETAYLVDSGVGREHQEYPHVELFDEDGFYLYKVVDGELENTTEEDKDEWKKQFTYNIYYAYNEDGFVDNAFATLNEVIDNVILVRTEYSKDSVPVVSDVLFDEDGFYLYKVVNNKLENTTEEDKEAWEEEKAKEEEERRKQELANAKAAKQQEISDACAAAIIAGVDIGEEHFSYDMTDQNNIYNLTNLAVQTNLSVPYHADSQSCRLFTKDEMVEIYTTAELNVTSQTTYNNQMRQYIDTLETIEEVNEVTFGDPLTGEYLETYNEMVSQAEEALKQIYN